MCRIQAQHHMRQAWLIMAAGSSTSQVSRRQAWSKAGRYTSARLRTTHVSIIEHDPAAVFLAGEGEVVLAIEADQALQLVGVPLAQPLIHIVQDEVLQAHSKLMPETL